jgi:hypothetical protein
VRGIRWHWPGVRDAVTFVVGAGGLVHEIAIQNVERPTILMICAGAMGLPAVMRVDDRRRAARDDGPSGRAGAPRPDPGPDPLRGEPRG